MPRRNRDSRPRTPLVALAAAGLLAPLTLSGCVSYRAEARNESAQTVRISIHKGTRQREISTVELAPGGHAAWSGVANGPVLLRVSRPGGVGNDVPLPRRVDTFVGVMSDGVWVEGPTAEDATSTEAAAAPPAPDDPAADAPAVETSETAPDTPPADDDEMIDLIED